MQASFLIFILFFVNDAVFFLQNLSEEQQRLQFKQQQNLLQVFSFDGDVSRDSTGDRLITWCWCSQCKGEEADEKNLLKMKVILQELWI